MMELILFAGQSNMSGRGSTQEAVSCAPEAGFEYKAVSRPGILLPVQEPFGLGEDRPGAITDITDDGRSKRTGSMVSAAVDIFYRLTGRQMVAVSASIGGSNTEEWLACYVEDAIARLTAAEEFLKKQEISVEHRFLVWCQGESDGDLQRTAEDYRANTMEIFHRFRTQGLEKCFLVQIGHFNDRDYPESREGLTGAERDACYGVIRRAQEELCRREEDFVLAGSFASHKEEMRDAYHYYQSAYNAVGKQVGEALAEYYDSIFPGKKMKS